jgi:hypothetical protein
MWCESMKENMRINESKKKTGWFFKLLTPLSHECSLPRQKVQLEKISSLNSDLCHNSTNFDSLP